MWLFGSQITELCLEFICYDPNYNYGSDDEDEFMETDMEDDEEEWVMRNRGFHDVRKICWWESRIWLPHDRHSVINNYWMRVLWYPEYSRSRGTQRRFPRKRIEKSFHAIQSTFRSLEMYSKQRYKICICSVILGELEAFRNYKGFSVIFPKILDAVERFTKVRIVLLSISVLNRKILGFRFYEN